MTLTKSFEGTLIHYPNNKDMFEFDGDVAVIFDDMAERSIPLYAEAHRLHAHIAYKYIKNLDRDVTIADVGASTGGFIEAMHKEAWSPYHAPIPGITAHALDISQAMLDQIAEKLPYVLTYEQDIGTMANVYTEYDVLNCSYVLQFLQGAKKQQALHEMRASMKTGGLLILSQKELIQTSYAEVFQNHYIDFRLENDYTKEEIEAKTRALKGSMFPINAGKLNYMLDLAGFHCIQETARWLQFSSLIAIAK